MEYTNQRDSKNIFNDPNAIEMKEAVDRIKAAAGRPSVEYIFEWVKQEAREIEVLFAFIAFLTKC